MEKKVKFSEDTEKVVEDESIDLSEDEFMVEMMNNYLEYYKKKNKKSQSFTLLDEIDVTDTTSTNFALESFYEEMIKFRTDELENNESTKIIPFDESIDIKKNNFYVIKKNNIKILMSKSFFAILIEITNLKREEEIQKKSNYYEIIID